MQARLRAEEAKRAALEAERRTALEAERRAVKETAERQAIETSTRVAARAAQEEDAGRQMNANSAKKSQSASNIFFKYLIDWLYHALHVLFSELSHLILLPSPIGNVMVGNVLWAAESALNLEQARIQRLKEVDEGNQALRLNYNKVLLTLQGLSFEILELEYMFS